MKNICLLLFAGLLLVSCEPAHIVAQTDSYEPAPLPPPPAPVEEVSYQSFYDQLSPYGNWISYPGYGYVWMPNAGRDFRPYASNGNWIYTDAGWTWNSNYEWGWAPFHYGRWFFDNGYGWMWIPGNEWAPAWVSWRGGGDYYGWAPLGPRVSADMAMNNYEPPVNYWNFVPSRYMGNPGWHNYYVNENRNVTIINNTTIINNYSGSNRARYAYAPGPDPNEVRRVSGNNFQTVQIREANTPGERMNGAQYSLYRPRINAQPTGGNAVGGGRPAMPAPARVQPFNGGRPAMPNQNNTQPVNSNQPNYNNNPSPATRPAVNNPRPSVVPPGSNPNNYNQPATQPVSNRPVTQPLPQPALQPVPGRPVPHPNNQSVPQPNNQSVPTRPVGQPATNRLLNQNNPFPRTQPATPANPAPNNGRPQNNHGVNGTRPVQPKPQTPPPPKPAPASGEIPKTREAN